jgi:hypothetical protein
MILASRSSRGREEATRISSLPRILLIDNKGVLRWDLSSPPWDLEGKLTALIKESP